MKTILVTGAAGLIGSHLCDRLLTEGYKVIGTDNLFTGSLDNLSEARKHPNFHFELRDVREPLNVYPDAIFNLACPASPVHYQKSPIDTFTTSVMGVHQLIKGTWSRRCPIIHTSTSEVYGDPHVHPQHEGYWGNVNPVGPRSCYDEGKRGAETLLSDARRVHGMDTRIVRLFNVYGPRMAFDDGRIVSNFITQVLRNKPITIYGDGTQTRSFCYVSDIIDALIKVLNLPSLDGPINLGNPNEYTVLDFALSLSKALNVTTSMKFMDLPIDDPKQRKPDITKARELLNWEPKVVLEDGMRMTAQEFRERIRRQDGLNSQDT
jgi:UDP-glucuronate decarboxylase